LSHQVHRDKFIKILPMKEQEAMKGQFAKLQTGQERWEVYRLCLDKLAADKKDLTR